MFSMGKAKVYVQALVLIQKWINFVSGRMILCGGHASKVTHTLHEVLLYIHVCTNSQDSSCHVSLYLQTGVNPLHVVCDRGHAPLVQLLIQAGADLDIPTNVCHGSVFCDSKLTVPFNLVPSLRVVGLL